MRIAEAWHPFSFIDPLKKWYNYTAVNNYRDEGDNDKRLFFEESLGFFKEPDTIFEKMMKPPISMTIALGLFMYNFLKGTRIFSKKDNLNEIPLGRIARTLGFLLLSESALIKHDKLFAASYLSNVFEPENTNSNMQTLALQEYAQMMAAGIDHSEALLKIGFIMEYTKGVMRDQAERLHSEKRVWLQYAKMFKFFSLLLFAGSIVDTYHLYQKKRSENPLQTRMEAVKRSLFERPSHGPYHALQAYLPQPKSSAIKEFPEEKINEEARRQKQEEKKARAERKDQREKKEKEDQKALEARQKADNEAKIKKEHASMVLKNIRGLNAKTKSKLSDILKKGEHPNIDSDDFEAVFGKPDKHPNIPPFKLTSSSDGTLIQFNEEVIDGYHRQHGKQIHERTFNNIREKFESLDITAETVNELSPKNGTDFGSAVFNTKKSKL